MAVLAIGVVAALLVVLTLGFALLVEIRSVRGEIAHGNKTQHRIALIEGGRYRSSKRTLGERTGQRTDYEDRSSRYAKASRDKLESIRALLAGALAAPERAKSAESAGNEEHHQGEPAPTHAESDSDEGRDHSELAPARVAKAAQEIKDRRAAKRATAAASELVDVEQPATIGGEEDGDLGADRHASKLLEAPGAVAASTEIFEEEATTVWTAAETAHVRREAAAGGATRHPRVTPRAALSVDIAPPASAPPSPLSRAAQLAAGLERPKSTRSPPHALPVRVRTETLAGMASPLQLAPLEGDASEERPSWPSLKQHGSGPSTRPPAGPAPVVAAPRFPPTLLSMQAQRAPTVLDPVPPMYARQGTMRPSAPLGDPDLIGSEGRADEAARPRLGPDEPTPPRGVRAAALQPVAQVPEEGA